MPVRAKFRCLSVTSHWSGEHTVKLGPVKRDKRDAENDFFWRYTPSGEMELSFPAGREQPLRAGDYYFVDLQPQDGGAWRLNGLDRQDYAVNVSFYCSGNDPTGCAWGCLKMGLSPETAGARDALQPHGSLWDVRLTHAEDREPVPPQQG